MSFTPDPDEIVEWAQKTFGPVACSQRERALRFIEEAIEVGHAAGLDSHTITLLLNRVYAKAPNTGDVGREIGQARMTLAALAWVLEVNDDIELAREWDRVRNVPRADHRARHRRKIEQGIAES